MALAARKITPEYVEEELIKAGINREVAFDLSNRYYNSELTVQDLKITELKLENKIDSLESKLENKIGLVKADLENKIDHLDNKIDSVKSEMKAGFNLHNWMLTTMLLLMMGTFTGIVLLFLQNV